MASWWEVAFDDPNGEVTEILPHTIFHNEADAQAFIDRLTQSIFNVGDGQTQEVRANGQVYFTGTPEQVNNWFEYLYPLEIYDNETLGELTPHLHNLPNWPPIPFDGEGTENQMP